MAQAQTLLDTPSTILWLGLGAMVIWGTWMFLSPVAKAKRAAHFALIDAGYNPDALVNANKDVQGASGTYLVTYRDKKGLMLAAVEVSPTRGVTILG